MSLADWSMEDCQRTEWSTCLSTGSQVWSSSRSLIANCGDENEICSVWGNELGMDTKEETGNRLDDMHQFTKIKQPSLLTFQDLGGLTQRRSRE